MEMSGTAMKMAAAEAKKEAAGKVSGLLPQEYVGILRTYLGCRIPSWTAPPFR